MRVGWDYYFCAGIVDFSITAIASPTRAVGIIRVSVAGNLHEDAFIPHHQVAAIALPGVAGRIQVPVRRHYDRNTGVVDSVESSDAYPIGSIGTRSRVLWQPARSAWGARCTGCSKHKKDKCEGARLSCCDQRRILR